MEIHEWIISLYLSVGFFLSQFLRSYYVKRDPQYSDVKYNRQWHNYVMDKNDKGKGRFEVGFSYFHSRKDTVRYRYGYITAIFLGITTLGILIPIFHLLPPYSNIGATQYIIDYLVWLIIPIVVIYCISDVFGPSLTKLVLNGALIVMVGLMIYVSFPDVSKPFWPIVSSLIAFVTLLVGIGYYWVISWVRDRVGKYGVIATYRAPTIYYGGSLAYIVIVGIIGTILIILI